MDYASSPHDFKLMLASSGRRASDISQMLDADDDQAADEAAPAVEYGAAPPAPAPAVGPPLPAAEQPAGDVHVDYGSPEHAYGRSVTPVAAAPPPAPPPQAPPPPSQSAPLPPPGPAEARDEHVRRVQARR